MKDKIERNLNDHGFGKRKDIKTVIFNMKDHVNIKSVQNSLDKLFGKTPKPRRYNPLWD